MRKVLLDTDALPVCVCRGHDGHVSGGGPAHREQDADHSLNEAQRKVENYFFDIRRSAPPPPPPPRRLPSAALTQCRLLIGHPGLSLVSLTSLQPGQRSASCALLVEMKREKWQRAVHLDSTHSANGVEKCINRLSVDRGSNYIARSTALV